MISRNRFSDQTETVAPAYDRLIGTISVPSICKDQILKWVFRSFVSDKAMLAEAKEGKSSSLALALTAKKNSFNISATRKRKN